MHAGMHVCVCLCALVCVLLGGRCQPTVALGSAVLTCVRHNLQSHTRSSYPCASRRGTARPCSGCSLLYTATSCDSALFPCSLDMPRAGTYKHKQQCVHVFIWFIHLHQLLGHLWVEIAKCVACDLDLNTFSLRCWPLLSVTRTRMLLPAPSAGPQRITMELLGLCDAL